jgi:hypothetical protein
MKEESTNPEIETLKSQIKEKTNELDNAIEQGEIFEKTRKLYLEMKVLKERLTQHLEHKI